MYRRKDVNPAKKPAANYFQRLQVAKMKNLNGDFPRKTPVRFIGNTEWKSIYWICDMSTRGFLIEILLHRHNAQQAVVISGFSIHVYYSQIMKTFSQSICCFLINIQIFFNDYDVTTLEIIHPITFRNYTKHPMKVLRNKINIILTCNLFIKRFIALYLNIFVPNVFNLILSHF